MRTSKLGYIQRRRKCKACGKRMTTSERVIGG
jgi:transcriptional regulator NrdR family protein